MKELTDAEVFGSGAVELSDAEVFGNVGFDDRTAQGRVPMSQGTQAEFLARQAANSNPESMGVMDKVLANPLVGGATEVLADIPRNLYNLPAYGVNAIAGRPVMKTAERGESVIPEFLPSLEDMAKVPIAFPPDAMSPFPDTTPKGQPMPTVAGLVKGVEDVGRGLLTPDNIMALGAGANPKLMQAIGTLFGVTSAAHLPQAAAEVGRLSVEGTPAETARAGLNAVAQAAIAGHIAGKAALNTKYTPREKVLEPEVVDAKGGIVTEPGRMLMDKPGDVIDLEAVKTGEGTVYRPQGEQLKQIEGPRGEFVVDPIGQTMDMGQLTPKERTEFMRGPREYSPLPEKKGYSPEPPVINTPEQQVVTTLKNIEARLNEMLGGQKPTPAIVPAWQASGDAKEQGGQISFNPTQGTGAISGAPSVNQIPSAGQSAIQPPQRSALMPIGSDAASLPAPRKMIAGEGQSATQQAKAPQSEDGKLPLNPGGSEASLTPEQQAKSRQNNSLREFARANGVEFVEGDNGQSILKKIQAKKASGSTVEADKLPPENFTHILGNIQQKVKNAEYLGDITKAQAEAYRVRGDKIFEQSQTDPAGAREQAKKLNEEVGGDKKDPRTGQDLYGGLFFLDPKFWKNNFGKDSYVAQDAKQLYNRIKNKMNEKSQAWKELDVAEFREFMKEGVKRTPSEVEAWVKKHAEGVRTQEEKKNDEWWKGVQKEVEVKKFGGRIELTPEQKELVRIEHEIWDNLDENQRVEVESTGHWTEENFVNNAKKQGINEQDAKQIRKFLNLRSDAGRTWNQIEGGQEPHWSSVAPKPESDMKDYVEIAVVRPGTKRQYGYGVDPDAVDPRMLGKDYEEYKFPSSHNFPPNTLGFVRGYMEGDTFHVIEVQSDWAQQLRELKADEKSGAGEPYNPGYRAKTIAKQDDPLLAHYERLALKSAIEHARASGAKRIAIQDAESAMLMEGHDRGARYETKTFSYGDKAQAEKYAQETNGKLELQGNNWYVFGDRKIINQEKGMRLHYDRVMPQILEELTGSKGEKVSFGEHKMAMVKAGDFQETPPQGLTPAEQRQWVDQGNHPRKDLIFKNPDGTPKTDVSARVYPLDRPKETLAMSKRVSGANVGRAMDLLGASMYDKNLSQTVSKELLQNSFDAVKGVAKPQITFDYAYNSRWLQVADNGVGMSPEHVITKMLPAFESGKDASTSAGGYGLAKVAVFGSAEKFSVDTVAEVDGKLLRTEVEGTGKDWLDFVNSGADIPENLTVPQDIDLGNLRLTITDEEVGTPTGTRVRVTVPQEKFNPYSAQEFFKKTAAAYPGDIEFLVRDQPVEKLKNALAPVQKTIESKGGKIEIRYDATETPEKYGDVPIMNNGLMQFTKYFNEDVKLPKMSINIIPEVSVMDSEYPFTNNRDGLKGDANAKVNELIKQLAAEYKNTVLDRFRSTMNSASQIQDTQQRFLDISGKLSPEKVQAITSNITLKMLTRALDKQHKDAFRYLNQRYGNHWTRANFAGLAHAGGFQGVRFGTSQVGSKGDIYYDMFHIMEPAFNDVAEGKYAPSETSLAVAERLSGVMLHEIAHQISSYEGETHAIAMTELAGRLAGILEKTVQDVTRILGNEQKVSELYEWYKEQISGAEVDNDAASDFIRQGQSEKSTGSEGVSLTKQVDTGVRETKGIGGGAQRAVERNKEAGAIPNPFRKTNRPIKSSEFQDLPEFKPYSQEVTEATTPQGIGRVPGLSRLFDPRAYRTTPDGKAMIANAVMAQKGQNFAALWMERHRDAQRAFEVDDNGRFTNANGGKEFMSDVIEAELKNPGSQRLTPGQKRFVAEWKSLRQKFVDMAVKEGVKFFVDEDTGLPIPINAAYFPRPAVGKIGIKEGMKAAVRKQVGGKQFFAKGRQFETEAEGVKFGLKYEPDEYSRIGRWTTSIYKAIADARLANDPVLQGRPGRPKFLEEGMVFQPAFAGRVFPTDVAKRLNQYYGETTHNWVRALANVNDQLKAAQFTLDGSAPFNQGLPLMGVNPLRWARATALSYKAFLDDRVLNKYLKQPENVKYAKMITENGGSLIRLQDFLIGAGEGKLLHKVAPIRASGRSMGNFLTIAKIELMKAFEPIAKEKGWSTQELVEAVENAVLSGKMEMIGLAPGRTLGERLLFNAPSYIRGAVNLTAMAGQGKISGKVARRALVGMATAITATLYALYKMSGMDDDEIVQRFDPRNPNFYRYPHLMSDGRRKEIGYGNIMISLARLLGSTVDIATGKKELGVGTKGDPWLRWLSYRKSPLGNLIWQLGTGEDYRGEPIGKMETLGKSIVPVSLEPLTEKGTRESKTLGVAAQAFGLSTFDESPGAYRRRLQDETAKQKYGTNYFGLSMKQRSKIGEEVDPRVKALGEKTTPRQVMSIVEASDKRRKNLVESLSPENQEWLTSRKLEVMGYQDQKTVNGNVVRLANDEEKVQLAELMSKYTEEAIGKLRVNNREYTQERVDEVMELAHKKAWRDFKKSKKPQ